jgi:ABC-type dipeptide/oligopeptide/nickel transport system permease subunit
MGLALLAGLSGMIFYWGKTASKELGAELSFSWAIVLPIIALVLVFLAMKAIGKDEALIRSIDRIR